MIIQKWWTKKKSCIGTNISICYNNLQIIVFKIHSYEKKFGKNDMQSFSKVIMLVHYISFVHSIRIESTFPLKIKYNLPFRLYTMFSHSVNID
jgi:hypothetical protein